MLFITRVNDYCVNYLSTVVLCQLVLCYLFQMDSQQKPLLILGGLIYQGHRYIQNSFPNNSSNDRFPLLNLTILDVPSTVGTFISQLTFESITLAEADFLPLDPLSSEFSLDSEIVSSELNAANDDAYKPITIFSMMFTNPMFF